MLMHEKNMYDPYIIRSKKLACVTGNDCVISLENISRSGSG